MFAASAYEWQLFCVTAGSLPGSPGELGNLKYSKSLKESTPSCLFEEASVEEACMVGGMLLGRLGGGGRHIHGRSGLSWTWTSLGLPCRAGAGWDVSSELKAKCVMAGNACSD